MKKTGKLIAVNFAIFIMLIIFLEIIFRIVGFGYGDQPVERDAVLRHVHPKNYSFKMYDKNKEYGGHMIHYDETGKRVSGLTPDLKTGKEIWFIGDSFTEANEVSWEYSFVGRLDRATKNEVLNFGVMGYSPLLYYIQLSQELRTEKLPEIVFIQLYSNDVTDDDNYEKTTVFDHLDRPLSCNGGKNNEWIKLLRRSYVARVARKTQLTLQHLKQQKRSDHSVEKMVLENFIEESVDFDRESRFSKSVLQLNQLLDSLKIEHYFFAIPSKYSCTTGNWEFNSFSAKFNEFAELNTLPAIQLDKAFEKASKNDKLFYDLDIHCNEKGNELIANELIKKINRNGNF